MSWQAALLLALCTTLAMGAVPLAEPECVGLPIGRATAGHQAPRRLISCVFQPRPAASPAISCIPLACARACLGLSSLCGPRSLPSFPLQPQGALRDHGPRNLVHLGRQGGHPGGRCAGRRAVQRPAGLEQHRTGRRVQGRASGLEQHRPLWCTEGCPPPARRPASVHCSSRACTSS